jgi:hypothetical protein
MAVCNLFNDLCNSSGNFLLFSQYVEDITRNYADGDNYKVVPTGFVALNIDYNQLNAEKVLQVNGLNNDIPKYFQNYYENGCAYGRNNIDWNSNYARNLFWNSLVAGNFISKSTVSNKDNVEYNTIQQIVYYGDINMHSYNEHQNMGYDEVYCYIPTDAKRMNYQVIYNTDNESNRNNESEYLEGFTGNDNYKIGEYSKEYSYNKNYEIQFDNAVIDESNNSDDASFNINTIVVLYSVMGKTDNNWDALYSNIPMGMYIAGTFDDNGVLSNPITKHVSTTYNTGTAYGLRICTRFSATSNGKIIDTHIVANDSDIANICQLMTAMNKNLSCMLDITKSAINTTQGYKDLLSIIKNNRINVPYVKTINGVDRWFVNGRYIADVNYSVTNEITNECDHTCPETSQNSFVIADPADVINKLNQPNNETQQ